VKGVGEAGTIGSTAAVVNAVVDALAPFGVEHLEVPLRPEKLWRAMHGGCEHWAELNRCGTPKP
jgi:carbon-monoxide dehydrogenase large subunit